MHPSLTLRLDCLSKISESFEPTTSGFDLGDPFKLDNRLLRKASPVSTRLQGEHSINRVRQIAYLK